MRSVCAIFFQYELLVVYSLITLFQTDISLTYKAPEIDIQRELFENFRVFVYKKTTMEFIIWVGDNIFFTNGDV